MRPQAKTSGSTCRSWGPEPFLAPPHSLDSLVKAVPAAVVAEIVGPGTLKFESVEVPYSAKRSVRGDVTYHVVVRDVLFNKDQSAPPLTAGAKMEFAQDVGRMNAEAFLAKQIPVAPGDECLLFLWRRGGGWAMLRWFVQFRKSREVQGAAEGIGEPSVTKFIDSAWLGSVPFASTQNGAMPDWNRLVDEVRRLARQNGAS